MACCLCWGTLGLMGLPPHSRWVVRCGGCLAQSKHVSLPMGPACPPLTRQDKMFKGYQMSTYNQILYTTLCSSAISVFGRCLSKSQLLPSRSGVGLLLHESCPPLLHTCTQGL
jgi:hypothetical protein